MYDMYICMYTIVKINVYVCTCLYIYLYVSKCDFNCVFFFCIYIYLYKPGKPKVHEAYMT